jgi:hypothetical protein
MINKNTHTCQQCSKKFYPAIYWFDSIHADNYEKRIIKPFCGPKCVHEWYEANDGINFPLRKPPFPKGDDWNLKGSIDDMNYETD